MTPNCIPFPDTLQAPSTYRHLLLTDQGPVLPAHQLGRACCPGCGQPWTRQAYLDTLADGTPRDGGEFACDACRIVGVLNADDAYTAWAALVGIDQKLNLHTFLLDHLPERDDPPPTPYIYAHLLGEGPCWMQALAEHEVMAWRRAVLEQDSRPMAEGWG